MSSKRIHKYKYRVLSRGNVLRPLISIKFWKWGFGVGYNTKKWIGGFALNSKKTPFPTNTQADSYTHKYPRKIRKS